MLSLVRATSFVLEVDYDSLAESLCGFGDGGETPYPSQLRGDSE